jgi:hypothetical protein
MTIIPEGWDLGGGGVWKELITCDNKYEARTINHDRDKQMSDALGTRARIRYRLLTKLWVSQLREKQTECNQYQKVSRK